MSRIFAFLFAVARRAIGFEALFVPGRPERPAALFFLPFMLPFVDLLIERKFDILALVRTAEPRTDPWLVSHTASIQCSADGEQQIACLGL